MSLDRKSPGSVCRKPQLASTVHFTSYKDVTRWRRQSRDRKWRCVAIGARKCPWSDVIWPEVTWGGCSIPKTRIYCTFHFLQGCSSWEEAVTWHKMTSRDFSLPEVTRKWSHLTGSHLEVAVEGQKLAYTELFTSYKAVARRKRQSRDRKSRHNTSGDHKWPGSDVVCTEVAWKWLLKAKKSRILYIWLPTIP